MKNLFLFALIAAFAAACSDVPVQDEMLENDLTLKKGHKMDKVDICHWDDEESMWVPISIAMPAWEAHEAHGDKLQYSPEGEDILIWKENTNNEIYGVYSLDIGPLQLDGTFTGTGTRDHDIFTITVEVYGTVDMDDGSMEFEMVQYLDGEEQLTFHVYGTVDQCEGIIEVHHAEGADHHFGMVE